PWFSTLSSGSISLATDTPSLVMRGAPKDLSITTLRPLGPSVTFTASARMFTPRSRLSRASRENFTSLAAISFRSLSLGRGVGQSCYGAEFAPPNGSIRLQNALADDAHDVGFLHDQEILTINLYLSAGPLAEQHAVALLHVRSEERRVGKEWRPRWSADP